MQITIESLKALLQTTNTDPQISHFLAAPSKWQQGVALEAIPQGSIIEVTGPARLEWVVSFMTTHSHLRTAWAETKFETLPPALALRRARLDQLLFVETGLDSHAWVTETLTSSSLFQIVVSNETHRHKPMELTALRRQQLKCKKTQTTLLRIVEHPSHAWPVAASIHTQKEAWQSEL